MRDSAFAQCCVSSPTLNVRQLLVKGEVCLRIDSKIIALCAKYFTAATRVPSLRIQVSGADSGARRRAGRRSVLVLRACDEVQRRGPVLSVGAGHAGWPALARFQPATRFLPRVTRARHSGGPK